MLRLGRRVAAGQAAVGEDEDEALGRSDRLVRQRLREEVWQQDDQDDENGDEEDEDEAYDERFGHAELVDETSSAEEGAGLGDGTDSEDSSLDAGPRGTLEGDESMGEDGSAYAVPARYSADGGMVSVDSDGDVDVDDVDDEVGVDPDEEEGEEGGGEAVEEDEDEGLISFDPMLLGLKEINNLAHFSVSSHKPGNGVEELLSDDLDKYWQSDGPQPHLLTIHFVRRVEIRAIRFFVDYSQDESYTPTSVVLSAGTGHHDLLEFAAVALASPVGWQDVDLSHVGGGGDGQSLCCWIVQIKVKENHQNGKDTHIRGIKLYAIDENAPPADGALDELARVKRRTLQRAQGQGQGQPADKEDYLYERLIAQSPDRLPGAPERSGSMAKFLRDMEIR